MLSVRAARRTPARQAQMVRLPRVPVFPADPADALREDLVDAAAGEWCGSGRAPAQRALGGPRFGTRGLACRLRPGPPSKRGGECARHDRVVRAQRGRRQPDDGVHRGQRAPRGDELDRISVEVPYLGAAPEEVESAVTVRIEEAIDLQPVRQLPDDRLLDLEREGGDGVDVVLHLVGDAADVGSEVELDRHRAHPLVRRRADLLDAVDIAVSGDMDPFTLKQVTERVRDELTVIPGITQVDIVSAPPYEISVEVSENALRRHELTFDQVADAERRSSLDLPGGSVRTDGGEILLRTIGQAYRGAEFEHLVLWTRADGSRLR